MSRTVAALLAESLAAHGVDRVFCVPGESYIGLSNVLVDDNRIQLVVCRHEGGAGYMAVADGRMTGRAGVCAVSRAPGLSNAMVAIHSAYHDATPLVVLIGQVERPDMGRLALQEQNFSRLLSDITKSVIEINVAETASEGLARAFHIAESGTPGPVAVVLPEDIFEEETEAALALPRPRPLPGARPEDIDRLAAMLAEAKRPLVWVGGAVEPAAAADLPALAERWMVPVMPTHRRPHLFDATHPHYGGYMGVRVPKAMMDALSQADLLVALGERITDSISQGFTFPKAPQPQFPFIHIWPDPGEIGRVWRADLGLASDPHTVIQALLARTPPASVAERRDWVTGLNAVARKLMAPAWDRQEDGVNFAAVVCGLVPHLTADTVVTTDAGSFESYVHRYLGMKPSQNFLTSCVGAMGAGVPMAVAAALRWPERRVVGIVGDGGALMTGNELATACLYGVNPVLVIADNRSYGSISMHHVNRYPGRPFASATGLASPDFTMWARSFGAEGISIRTEEEIAPALEHAFSIRTRPVVVHVHASANQMSAWRARVPPKGKT